MNCADYLAGRLAGGESPELAAHRAGCSACASSEADATSVAAMLADPVTWEEPSDGLEELVVAGIARAAGTDPADAGVATPQVLRVAEAPPRRSWGWLGWVAVAAVAIGVAVPVLRANEPDWEVTLAGAGANAEATAVVAGWTTESGTRMRLEAVGLLPAPEGYVYEVWLSSDDVHLSAGSFRAGDGVDLWTGVSRADFPRVWVTLEPIDADGSVNGDTVLDAGT